MLYIMYCAVFAGFLYGCFNFFVHGHESGQIRRGAKWQMYAGAVTFFIVLFTIPVLMFVAKYVK